MRHGLRWETMYYKFQRHAMEYYQKKNYYDTFTGGRKPKVRLCQLFLERFPQLQEFLAELRNYEDGVPDLGLPRGERQDIIVETLADLTAFGQCVLECEFTRGRDLLLKTLKEFLAETQPKVLWSEDDKPSYLHMNLIGRATDQYGPLIRLGKTFNGLTEENLLAMQKDLMKREQERSAEDEATGVPDAEAPRAIDEVSELSVSTHASTKRDARYDKNRGAKKRDNVRRNVQTCIRALTVCKHSYIACAGVY